MQQIEHAKIQSMDRWNIEVENGDVQLPLNVINNYLSVGVDAEVCYKFHMERQSNPEKFNSRWGNKVRYANFGVHEFLKFNGQSRELYKHIRIICDGKDETKRLTNLHAISLSILNIRSFSAGFKPWGSRHPASISDKQFEVLAFSQQQFANMYLANGHAEPIGQCHECLIKIDHPLAIQIDGEAMMIDKPCSLKISHRNQHRVLIRQKNDSFDEPVRNSGEMTRINIKEIYKNEDEFVEKNIGSIDLPLDLDLETIRPNIERLVISTNQIGDRNLDERKDFYFVDEEKDEEKFCPLEKSRELTLLRDFLAINDVMRIRTDIENCQGGYTSSSSGFCDLQDELSLAPN